MIWLKKSYQIRAEKHVKKIERRSGKKRIHGKSRTSKAKKYSYKFTPADDTKVIYGL